MLFASELLAMKTAISDFLNPKFDSVARLLAVGNMYTSFDLRF